MADVFVSYVSENRAIAEMISRGLQGAGLSVWWDGHIHGGVSFRREIDRQLRGARVVIVLWSAASLESEWVCDEAQQALDENKLIPVRLDNVQPPLGFRQAQSLDFSGWNGDPSAAAFTKLVRSARHFLADVAQGLLVPPVQVPASGGPLASRVMATSEKSIAVLPFTDMSEKHDQEYFADGMAEEIINLLAKVPELLVPARTSSFYFKGKQTKVPDIARELGVVHVLEGSIRRSGDHLRVTAKLVRADNGYHLWSESYDRDLRDVFKVQDDIANAVVQTLQIKLMGGELSRRKGGTENLEAYQVFLRAVSALNQNTASSRDASGEFLDQAIKLDPSYGMAWALLATTALVKTVNGLLDPVEGVERVRQLAQHALQLSPDLAGARASLVWAFMLTWDWAAAEAELQRAVATDPTDPQALEVAAQLSLTLGHWADAERQNRAALGRDPLNPFMIDSLGDVYYKTGRYAEAEVMYRKALALAPASLWYHQTIAYALLQQGKVEAALAMARQEADEGIRLLLLPIMLQANGLMAEADEALQAQIARWADRGAFFVAMSYAYRGDRSVALQWLERAYQQKDAYLWNIVGEPLLENLADDPRYKAFLRKMKLPE